jgi:hypothetical protein
MLGIEIAQSTVSKYMVRGREPPSQSWKTFLRNHADALAAIDMCVVPTVSFESLFGFLVVGHKGQVRARHHFRLGPAEWERATVLRLRCLFQFDAYTNQI